MVSQLASKTWLSLWLSWLASRHFFPAGTFLMTALAFLESEQWWAISRNVPVFAPGFPTADFSSLRSKSKPADLDFVYDVLSQWVGFEETLRNEGRSNAAFRLALVLSALAALQTESHTGARYRKSMLECLGGQTGSLHVCVRVCVCRPQRLQSSPRERSLKVSPGVQNGTPFQRRDRRRLYSSHTPAQWKFFFT